MKIFLLSIVLFFGACGCPKTKVKPQPLPVGPVPPEFFNDSPKSDNHEHKSDVYKPCRRHDAHRYFYGPDRGRGHLVEILHAARRHQARRGNRGREIGQPHQSL